MLDIIQHNPYRTVGVFTTATRKDIVANITRIKANIRVNRQIAFHSDLEGVLPSTQRTIETIADAESKLTLPKDLIHMRNFGLLKTRCLTRLP